MTCPIMRIGAYDTSYIPSKWKINFVPKFEDRTTMFGIVWIKEVEKPVTLPEYLDVFRSKKAKSLVVEYLKRYGVIRKRYPGEYKVVLLRSAPDYIQTILIFDEISDTLLLKLGRL